MKRDNAPVSQTCPKIDDVINSLKELYKSSEEMSSRELTDLENTMEKIRSDNSDLRSWGNEQYDRAEELEKEMEYYKDLAEGYKSEITELKQEIKDLSITA